MDKKLIRHVASLARLSLSSEEEKEFLWQLEEVMDAFSKIQEVDTQGVEAMLHPVAVEDATREDEPGKSLSQEDAVSNARHTKKGYIKGPKVV